MAFKLIQEMISPVIAARGCVILHQKKNFEAPHLDTCYLPLARENNSSLHFGHIQWCCMGHALL